MPSGFAHLLHTQSEPSSSSKPQLSLYVRQQPAAARVCAGGKSRRTIDPIPIVQLLIEDFSASSKEHVDCLTHDRYVVSCELFSVPNRHETDESHFKPFSVAPRQRKVGNSDKHDLHGSHGENVRILSGSLHANPFFVAVDPEPDTTPEHPQTMKSTSVLAQNRNSRPSAEPPPSTFFIFPDLSVRLSGLYRLLFKLVDISNVGPHAEIPILSETWSQGFEVFAPKDFPGMSSTTNLASKLKEQGAIGIKLRRSRRGTIGGGPAKQESDEDSDEDKER